jgi:hypothetical protein
MRRRASSNRGGTPISPDDAVAADEEEEGSGAMAAAAAADVAAKDRVSVVGGKSARKAARGWTTAEGHSEEVKYWCNIVAVAAAHMQSRY